MARTNIQTDLLPVLRGARAERCDEQTLAHSLPHVVWDRIAHYVSEHSPTLLVLATFSQDLKDICRPHLSKCFKKLPSGERFLHHRVLQLVLQRYVDPSYIYEIDCEDAKPWKGNIELGRESIEDFDEDFEYKYDAIDLGENLDHRKRRVSQLLREAVLSSPWISSAKEDEICERYQDADPDAPLAVLPPLCTKVKTLEIPDHADLCAAVVQAVAQAYHERGSTGIEARRTAWEAALRDRDAPAIHKRPEPDALPFSELLILYTQDRHWVRRWVFLTDSLPFIGIPSLHRVILDAARDRGFAWPPEVVKCSCPEIWLHRSLCTPRAVRAFAEGMVGPCEIRQHFSLDGEWVEEDDQAELTWDSVLVRRREDGSKDVEMRIEFEGGDPGYEHAWVSWMFWGKMQNWRRLDEEFSLQEGDERYTGLGAGTFGVAIAEGWDSRSMGFGANIFDQDRLSLPW